MSGFLAMRIVTGIVALLLVSIGVYLFPYIAEGDPIRAILRSRTGQLALDEGAIAAMREALGLDRPLYAQYLEWLWNALRGDFGYSFTTRMPVVSQIWPALLNSLLLITTALAAAVAISIPLSMLMAMRKGGVLDATLMSITQCFIAIPEYWMAPVLMLVFALYLNLLPAAGWDGAVYLVLPASVLALRPLAYFTHVTRASMSEVLEAPYITAARARGLSLAAATLRHGVRNALPPLVTLLGIWFGGLLAGAVLIEVIFAIPGMGRLIYTAVINRDLPLLQGSILTVVALQIVINTLSDLAHAMLNPAVGIDHD